MSDVGAFPPRYSRCFANIDKNVGAGAHDLKDNAHVSLHYGHDFGGFTLKAVAGTLTFDSLPETGHARGMFNAQFLEGGQTVNLTGDFDIKADVS